MKKRKDKKCIINLLILVSIFILVIPSIGNARTPGDIPDEDELEWVQGVAIPLYCKIGIAWVTEYCGLENIPFTKDDAEELECVLVCEKPQWHCGFDKNEQDVTRTQWEVSNDQNYVDAVHLAYYAGHGGAGKLVFKDVCGVPSDYARLLPDYCDWGDENGGKLKWVFLACCLAGQNSYRALDGVHMICGWKTGCTDAVYGPVLADHLIDGMTVKSAWFQTCHDLAEAGLCMNVVAEDISLENDHIYHCGTVLPDPPDDDEYYEWDEWTI